MSVDEVSIAITLASSDKKNLEAVRKTLKDIKKLDEDLDLTNISKNIGSINWGKLLGDAGLDKIKDDVTATKASMTDVVNKINTIEGILKAPNAVDATKKSAMDGMDDYMKSIATMIQKTVQNAIANMPSSSGDLTTLKADVSSMSRYMMELAAIQEEIKNRFGDMNAKLNDITTDVRSTRYSVSNIANSVANLQKDLARVRKDDTDDDDDDDDDDTSYSGSTRSTPSGGGYGGGSSGSSGGGFSGGRTGSRYEAPQDTGDSGGDDVGGSITVSIPSIGGGSSMSYNTEQMKERDTSSDKIDKMEQKMDSNNKQLLDAIEKLAGVTRDMQGRLHVGGQYATESQAKRAIRKAMEEHGVPESDRTEVEKSVLDKDDV